MIRPSREELAEVRANSKIWRWLENQRGQLRQEYGAEAIQITDNLDKKYHSWAKVSIDDFLEGTYLLHGIEEIMDKNEVVVLVEPFESEEEKIKECLVKGVGMKVISISSRETSFPTIKIPDGGKYHNYVELAAGWNVLVEIGIALGIDLDKPVRARKVVNEYIVG